MSDKPYKEFADLLKQYFPYKVQKISVNAGFTCPNRDGTKGRGGCTYCNNQSFSPGYGEELRTVSECLKEGIDFFSKKYSNMKFLAYFQSYTNTYDKLDSLIAKYEEAISYPNVVGLIIGTRPDCMPDELLNYFEELNKRTFLMIEYGVESTLDRTLKRVNRGHSYAESVDAIVRTSKKGILTGAHMILGLPGESRGDILNHAEKLSELPLSTIKLHQLQLIKGTVMGNEYTKHTNRFELFPMDEYIDLCVDFSERLNPDFVIERFVSQSPPDLLIAPEWGVKNHEITTKIKKRFAERNTWQGRLYNNKNL